MKNYFGYEIPSLFKIFDPENENLKKFMLDHQLAKLLETINIPPTLFNSSNMEEVFKKPENDSILNIEKELHSLFLKNNNHKDAIKSGLKERAQIIYSQIKIPLENFLEQKESQVSLLDIGCGNGMVTECIFNDLAKKFPIKLDIADVSEQFVKDHIKQEYSNVNFEQNTNRQSGYFFDKFIEIPTNQNDYGIKKNKYDIILLLTVLHHSKDPENVMDNCSKMLKPGGQIIVIESCFGINGKNSKIDLNQLKNINGQNLVETEQTEDLQFFWSLRDEQQILYGAFFDWFYNRVLDENVYVPYNFFTPEKWKNKVFNTFQGLSEEKVFYEGFDQVMVPEFHTIHLLNKA